MLLIFLFQCGIHGLFFVDFDCIEITILQQINVKNVHLVYYAGI